MLQATYSMLYKGYRRYRFEAPKTFICIAFIIITPKNRYSWLEPRARVMKKSSHNVQEVIAEMHIKPMNAGAVQHAPSAAGQR